MIGVENIGKANITFFYGGVIPVTRSGPLLSHLFYITNVSLECGIRDVARIKKFCDGNACEAGAGGTRPINPYRWVL